MTPGEILYAKHDELCCLKLVGDIRYTVGSLYMVSRSLDLLLDRLFDSGGFNDILIDMSETVCIDSTNLGLLARIAVHTKETFDRSPTIICDNPDVLRIMESMGCQRVFVIVKEGSDVEPELVPLEGVEASDRDRIRLLLKAHRALVGLSEENRAQFSDIVELLEKDLEVN